ncbi:cytochrome P450 [Mycobacterium sp. Aquia_213]|uniref:cytochrome P450 n=1 Tax=Mycobacterium sp. Aquia_213 TaxID=2991728 RepID=UPI00226D9F82|nr:cytochrome P450 [Mycobacterium sp. Aquia_213]WAC92453.1 cytochrome P450 [Mycobacterium sp. Aquia_213]
MPRDVLPPGPRLPAFIQLAAFASQPWKFLDSCAARYGDVFTLRLASQQPWVVVSHPDTVKEVLTGPPEVLLAAEGNRMMQPLMGANSLLLLEGDAHREQRRLIVPSFRGNGLKFYTDKVTAVTQAEIARWPRGRPVRLYPRMQELTLEVMLRGVFGLSTGTRLDQLRAELLRMLRKKSGPLMLTVGPPRMRAALTRNFLMGQIDRLVHAEIDDRRRAGDWAERSDLLSILLQARHADGQALNDAEIRDELVTMLLAGEETTATSLAWAVERLVRHPEHQARLIEETRVGDHRFVDAVVKETLRVRPVSSMVMRKLNAPMQIDGFRLPAGVSVVSSIYLTHRRPDLYPDPECFRPERFLDQPAGTYTWIAFGGGERRCLGATFAELEMRVVLSMLFDTFKVRPADERPEPVRWQGMLTPVPGRGATVVLE